MKEKYTDNLIWQIDKQEEDIDSIILIEGRGYN